MSRCPPEQTTIQDGPALNGKTTLTTKEILRRVLRNPKFWAIAGASLVASIAVRFLWHGAAGEFVSDALFLGAAFAGGAFARAEAGIRRRPR